MERGGHLPGTVNLNPLDLDRNQFVRNRLGESEVVLDGRCELLVVTSRVRVGGVRDLGRKAKTTRLREIIWRAESVRPEFRVNLVARWNRQ